MKRLLVLSLVLASIPALAQKAPLKRATCRPSGTCKACSNCSACKNCSKNGGTCSVCKKTFVVKAKARRVARR